MPATDESTMTRLYRQGRTETVRSATTESCAFVHSMEALAAGTGSRDECLERLRTAANNHQRAYR